MKQKRQVVTLGICLALLCLLFGSVPAFAHDLWLNADDHYPGPGQKTSVKVVFGHNFPYYDILIAKTNLSGFSCVRPDGETRTVDETWEDRKGERHGALAGNIVLDQEGTYVVTAYMKRKGDKEHVPSEKYGKSIIITGKGGGAVHSRVFGHRIEIIPLKNPSEVKAGDLMPVKVLFEGKPLSTYVYATYAGYYSESEPFAVVAKSDETGVANMRISRPGTWLIVSNHKVDISASLTFGIK